MIDADRVVVEEDEGGFHLIVEADGDRRVFRMDATTTEVLDDSLQGFRLWKHERDHERAVWEGAGRPGHHDEESARPNFAGGLFDLRRELGRAPTAEEYRETRDT